MPMTTPTDPSTSAQDAISLAIKALTLIDEFAWSALRADCSEARDELNRRVNVARTALARLQSTEQVTAKTISLLRDIAGCDFASGELDEFGRQLLRGLPARAKACLDVIQEQVRDGWQPIETAPKDGTKIDLFYPYPRGRTIDCFWKDQGWVWKEPRWKGGVLLPENEWHVGCYPNMAPTHWRPSPPPVACCAR